MKELKDRGRRVSIRCGTPRNGSGKLRLLWTAPVRTVINDPLLLRRLLRAKDRMDGAFDQEWPVRRLAQVSGVSEAHFARSFKTAFGLPPHRYLLSRRIERAKALLRDTDLPITAIAFETGWKSLGTFGRIFRDITGESPGQLRAKEKAASQSFDHVPHCFVKAAHRPDLKTAVSEKRRSERHVIHAKK